MLIDKYHKNQHIHAFYSVHSPTRSLSSTYVYSYHFYVCFINISYLYHFLSFKYISFLSFCDQSGSFCVILFSRWYFQCVIHINWTASIISDLTLFNIGLYYSLYLSLALKLGHWLILVMVVHVQINATVEINTTAEINGTVGIQEVGAHEMEHR